MRVIATGILALAAFTSAVPVQNNADLNLPIVGNLLGGLPLVGGLLGGGENDQGQGTSRAGLLGGLPLVGPVLDGLVSALNGVPLVGPLLGGLTGGRPTQVGIVAGIPGAQIGLHVGASQPGTVN